MQSYDKVTLICLLLISSLYLFNEVSCDRKIIIKPSWYDRNIKRDQNIIERYLWKLADSVASDRNMQTHYKFPRKGVATGDSLQSLWVHKSCYSPDLTKSIHFCILEEYEGGMHGYEAKIVYRCVPVYGVRPNIGNEWHYYLWVRYHSIALTASAAFEALYNRYTSKYMRCDEHVLIYPDSTSKELVSVKIGSNILDEDFWECPLWKKNARGRGVYLFQISPHIPAADIRLPVIDVQLTEVERQSINDEMICQPKTY